MRLSRYNLQNSNIYLIDTFPPGKYIVTATSHISQPDSQNINAGTIHTFFVKVLLKMQMRRSHLEQTMIQFSLAILFGVISAIG